MEPEMIMVLVLCAGVAALLVWFEIDSRRNEARMKQAAKPAQSVTLHLLEKVSTREPESEVVKRKAA